MEFGVFVGESLEDFSGVTIQDYIPRIKHWDVASDPDNRGGKVEQFMKTVLSLFDTTFISTVAGSKLDVKGVDFLIHSPRLNKFIGIQAKTSYSGVLHYKKNGDMGDRIIITWVNLQDRAKRKNFLFKLIAELKRLKINLNNEFHILKEKVNNFHSRKIKLRNVNSLFTANELDLLKLLGLVYVDSKGRYTFID